MRTSKAPRAVGCPPTRESTECSGYRPNAHQAPAGINDIVLKGFKLFADRHAALRTMSEAGEGRSMAGSRESSLEWKILVQAGGQNPHEGVASACRVDRLDRIRRCYFASPVRMKRKRTACPRRDDTDAAAGP